ncbi:MAG: hypothetical protein ABFD16_02400 [Thermoguttaceae bacterium]
MAEMTIRLQCDPETGKKEILVSLRSDADALPQEHEQLHRALVDRLIEGGIVKASEIGKITIQRDAEEKPSTPVSSSPQQERPSQAQGN